MIFTLLYLKPFIALVYRMYLDGIDIVTTYRSTSSVKVVYELYCADVFPNRVNCGLFFCFATTTFALSSF